MRSRVGARHVGALRRSDERGSCCWALAVTAVHIVVLSPALVRAERFIFPTYFVIGAVGVVAAIRHVGRRPPDCAGADRFAWLPVAVWMATFVLSLASKVLR